MPGVIKLTVILPSVIMLIVMTHFLVMDPMRVHKLKFNKLETLAWPYLSKNYFLVNTPA
jgi:hypothetical protein